ncbi:thioredoxin [Hamiltosporidium tvaerminnensis]|uniref:Thioredoxin n=2 Tax=Hamiltosporidium TaxID=1176354 RepID=A0A4Q9LNU6_9MICR|nr:thioredoxin [Hamiltosporidium tvaerminnensis]TBT98967.1 thioredoxin [Hamiltosporidium magnivora]TBU09161.1 thioredoxin [Hamiltosporidium magnivora]TBU12599.1 thioredoxin [Hamiltosporidium tvaerminnensis]
MLRHIQIESKEQYFDILKKNNTIGFVKMYATWCGPCNTMSKELERYSLPIPVNLYEIDIDKVSELAVEYKIRNIPALLVVTAEGKQIDLLLGYKDVNVFESLVTKHLDK